MNIFSILNSRSKFFYIYLAVFSASNSIMASSLLFFINAKLTGEALPYVDNYDWQVFVLVIIASATISYRFEMYMASLTQKMGVDLKTYILNYLRYSDYERYLTLTEEKVRTVLTDVTVLQGLPHTYLGALNSIIMIIIGLSYLFWTNSFTATILLVVIAITSTFFMFQLKNIQKYKNQVRDLADIYMRYINDFLRGFRELKMSDKKNETLYTDYLVINLKERMIVTLVFLSKFIKNNISAKYAIYIIIGVIIFVLPSITAFDTNTMTIYVTTFLFIAGPISDVINRMDTIGSISISLDRIKEFEDVLKAKVPGENLSGNVPALKEPFRTISLENVRYEYWNKDRTSKFKLKALNLVIERQEVIFITGGNGSGKSTFINLLSGLYIPTEGEIFYNQSLVQEDNYSNYRNLFSCVFTDNYLFSENYDNFEIAHENQRFSSLLKQMQLFDSVVIDKEKNRVSNHLSKGQQKRLALIYAILEDKDIYIFDEWAAEQDPRFRQYFYHSIIPQLKTDGKTVIAITHDNAYFNCADRVIEFEYGQIIKDKNLVEEPRLSVK